jgi:hypothetical protein
VFALTRPFDPDRIAPTIAHVEAHLRSLPASAFED